MPSFMMSAGLTVLLALTIGLLQIALKYQSRDSPTGGGRRLKLDDFVFWHEWVVTTTITMVLILIRNSQEAKPSSLPITMVCVVSTIVGYALLPIPMKNLLYDKDGNIKSVRYAVVANVIGLGFLVAAVGVGVKFYG